MSEATALSSSPFLSACAGRPVERPPVWVMRQAGRYLPEYRAVRAKHGFLDLCHDPELAATVSAQPIERFGFDAAIIFSDILIPPIAMGARVEFAPGPRLEAPIDSAGAVERLQVEGAREKLSFVPAAIRLLDERLGRRTPIIGFAGAPFTVAAYLVEGGGSSSFANWKTMLFHEPTLAHTLLEKLTRVTIGHLAAQRAAGARALMLFDTHASILSPPDYETFVAPYIERILAELGDATPSIYFAPGGGALLERIGRLGASVVGVDYRVRLGEARARLGDATAVQGNLDPAVLLGPRALVEQRTREMIRENAGRAGYIANLGHGIHKATPIANLETFIRCIREEGGGS